VGRAERCAVKLVLGAAAAGPAAAKAVGKMEEARAELPSQLPLLLRPALAERVSKDRSAGSLEPVA